MKKATTSTVTNAPVSTYCQSSTPLCKNGGTCIPQAAGYSCSCPANVYGTSCEFSNDL